jgi:hypothetical protein
MKLPHVTMPMLVFLVALLAACTPTSANPGLPSSTASPAEESWHACTQFIQSRLGILSADAPAYNPATVTTLANGQLAVAIYYPKTATVYRCGLVPQADGTWQLQSLVSLTDPNVSIWGLRK